VDIYIPPLTGKPEQQRFANAKWCTDTVAYMYIALTWATVSTV